MQVHFCEINGRRTRYLTAGSGPALLLLHPIGHSADVFVRNIDALGEHFCVIAPDLPGHGFSDMIDFSGTSPQLASARHMVALADHLRLDHYSVLGSSYGGLVAGLTWFERPAALRALILVGSGSALHTAEMQESVLAAVYENGSKAMMEPTLASCRVRLGNICYSPASVAEEVLLVQLTYYALSDRLDAFRNTVQGLIAHLRDEEHNLVSRLDRLTLPVLVLTGREDIRADWNVMAGAAAALPQGKLITFEKCGHLPYMEYPSQFNDALIAYLKDVA